MCIVENITKQQFLELKDNIVYLKNDITEIKDALLGNRYNPNGVMHRVTNLEQDVETLYKKVDNQSDIEMLKNKVRELEKGTKFWVTLANNRWIAIFIFAVLYMFSIKEVRDLVLSLLGIIN